jgi:UDP-N-acetylglucosamine 2-epimerase
MNAVSLLRREGIEGILTGDVMYDALLQTRQEDLSHPYAPPFVLVTIHRAENTDEPERFLDIWRGLKLLSQEVPVIFPAHPRTRNMFPEILTEPAPHIRVIDPVSYLSMLAMVRDASLVITDSGGVQKEAFLLGTPCVTVRDTTEWPETIQAGANRLVAAEPEPLIRTARAMMGSTIENKDNPFGSGRASFVIAGYIRDHFF